MSELRALMAAARELRRTNAPFVTATLVSVKGSSYRRPGARLLIAEDRWICGSVSGGCLERDLVRRAWWRTADGQPALVSYDSTNDGDDDLGWGIGLGCNGVVELLLERAGAGAAVDALDFIGGCLADEQPGALVTLFRTPRGDEAQAELALGACLAARADRPLRSRLASLAPALHESLARKARAVLATPGARPSTIALAGGGEALVERVEPPPHLFVMGARPDAVPVVRAARAVGWRVTVWAGPSSAEARRQLVEADRIAAGPARDLADDVAAAHRPVAVIMTHDVDRDREALAMLLASPCPYVGVLGPRARTDRLLAALGAPARPGTPLAQRLHAPVGLALGAETPDEVALAIVAEIQAVVAGEVVGHLRDRPGRIHAAAAVEQHCEAAE
ncbi:MAG TPA: XdhC family protein [Polyangia bacterium]|nr:XdhC family protein [Polyangia bacterium]